MTEYKADYDAEDGKPTAYKVIDETGENVFGLEEFEQFIQRLNSNFHMLAKSLEMLGVPLDLIKDFAEWSERIDWLDKTNRRLAEIEEIYLLESQRIISEAQANNIDFKAIYGANNKDVRQQYADEQLADLLEEKQELEFLKADDNRRISFLYKLIDLKIQLIKYDKTVEVH